jgi:hypothetical protein
MKKYLYKGLFNFLKKPVTGLAWLLLLVANPVTAQTIKITGKVIDGTTREPVSFAAIHIKNSAYAAMADSMGNFAVSINGDEVNMEVSSIGYKLKTVKMTTEKNIAITIVLAPINMDLKEVVISPGKRKKRVVDTAALYVLNKVLNSKPLNNPQAVPNYYTHEHSKLVISFINVSNRILNSRILQPFGFFFDTKYTTTTGEQFIPLLIEEEYNETFHRADPLLNRKVIYYRHLSGFKKNFIANLAANQFAPIDIYKNTYIIMGKSFTSPFSPAARFTYTYHILDTVRNAGAVAYKLNFVAKNKEDVALKGYALIDSATWGIQEIHFKPNERANVNFLIDYSVDQKFEKTDSGWVMKNEKLDARGNLLEKQHKLAVYMTKSTLRDSVLLNHAIPDSVARVKDDIIVNSALTRPRNYLDSLRISPLDSAEKHIYHSFDTAVTVKAYKRFLWLGNFFSSGNFKAGPLDFGRSYYLLSRNSVEGYRIRMGVFTNDDFSRLVYLYGHVAYGTLDKTWKYEADAHIKLPTRSNRWNSLWLESKNDMTVLGEDNPLLTYDNVLTLLSPGSKNNTVMHVAVESAKYEHDWFKGLSTIIGTSFNRFYSTPGAFVFQQPVYGDLVKNLPGFNTNEFMAEIRYCQNDQYVESYSYRYFVPTEKPSFTFRYTWGLPNTLYADYAYHKFQAMIKQIIYMPVVGYGKLNFTSGYILGNAPYPTDFMSSGNIGFFKDEQSFQLTKLFEFTSDKYVSLWYEQHFEGLLFNHIPYVKLLKLREFISAKAMWGGMSSANKSLILLPEGMQTASTLPYVELGFGVENILKVIQLNFIWRATYRNTPGAPNFAVKIAIKPGF